MGARGDLRHDAAERGVQIELRAHHIRQDLAARRRPRAAPGRLRSRRSSSRCRDTVAGCFGGSRHGAFYRVYRARLKGEAKGALMRPASFRPFKLKEFSSLPPTPASDRHARQPARALAGAPCARAADRGAWLERRRRRARASSPPQATASPTSRCAISAARACSPRRSTRRFCRGAVDLAVHSMKDLPTVLPRGHHHRRGAAARPMCATPSSAPRRRRLPSLPPGAVVGTLVACAARRR